MPASFYHLANRASASLRAPLAANRLAVLLAAPLLATVVLPAQATTVAEPPQARLSQRVAPASQASSNGQPAGAASVAPTATASTQQLWCGLAPLEITPEGDQLKVRFQGETRTLVAAISASGARYTLPNDESTQYWGKGDQGTLTWNGEDWPTCAPAGAVITPFTASGNEPFWRVEYTGWTLNFSTPEASYPPVNAEVVESSPGRTVVRSTGTPANEQLTLTVSDQLCQDSMSGMPYPQTVSLQRGNTTLQGCGGQPARLLQGANWNIISINGTPVLPDTQATIRFDADQRLSGSTGCNRFMGSYSLRGEGLSASQLAGTRMACPGPVEGQEQAILAVLNTLQGFERPDDQRLVLRGEQGVIAATLAQP